MTALSPADHVLPSKFQPRIYYVHPLMLDGFEAWQQIFQHAKSLGFDSILSAPLFETGPGTSIFTASSLERPDARLGLGDDLHVAIRQLTTAADGFGLAFMMDLVVDRLADDRDTAMDRIVDPRTSPELAGSVAVTSEQDLTAWSERIAALVRSGIRGFRCLDIDRVRPELWKQLVSSARDVNPACAFLAWTPGISFQARTAIKDVGFDASFLSSAWWDLEQRWLLDEYELQRDLGAVISLPEAPFGKRAAHGHESVEVQKRRSLRALSLAPCLGGALLVPMGFEFGAEIPLDPMHGDGAGLRVLRDSGSFDICAEITQLNQQKISVYPYLIEMFANTGSSAVVLIQADKPDLRMADNIRVVMINRDLRLSVKAPWDTVNLAASRFLPLLDQKTGASAGLDPAMLRPGEVLVFAGRPALPVTSTPSADLVAQATAAPRLVIEKVTPAVDDGLFPVKRVVGETLHIEADIFGDGHDLLAASVLWRAADADEWSRINLKLVVNDRWAADIVLDRLGAHEFVIEAWRNPFAIFHYELGKKHAAALNLTLELQEGRNLVEDARVNCSNAAVKEELGGLLKALSGEDAAKQTDRLLSAKTVALMERADRRPFSIRSQVFKVEAERTAAAFASWYQIFPRSQSGDPDRHGTFDDVIGRLPAIKEMGFDVLYFPPIHPIGATNRKGRNNSLTAAPGDPGSPYAIGSPDGGHDAIHPELGTFEDFRRLIAAAAQQGLEIALDLAIQASPDHPWLKEHPGWFDWRPDGTVRYAENPPKKYEDIVNVDFYAKDAMPSLWLELRDVVQLWVDQGVKIFRVDNPHTKPFPFWEWMIADIRARHPEVIFLSEAFTKPKVMYRLAKVGFSQSYTYFTWRNEKWELERYMHEITTEEPKEFFRPHFFVNTHDINPDFLQNAPRSAYLIRAALAATLSGLWGVYNGFELCEGRPDAKGKEYADSEKYEIRAWDWDRPGNIKAEITALNKARRQNPALHSHLGLTLLNAPNDNVLFFEKASPGRENVLLIAISLDPHNAQDTDIELPLWSWKLPDDATLAVEDVMTNQTISWTGKWQRIRLDPAQPFAIWRVK